MASAIAVACSSAFADEFNIAVKGVIKPAACTAALAGGGTFDYGNIGTALLSPTSKTLLEVKSDTLTITCDAHARVALKGADNRAGTVAFNDNVGFFGKNWSTSAFYYGLGTASGKKIGAYMYRFKDDSFIADGAQALALYSDDGGSSWSLATGVLSPDGRNIVGWGEKPSNNGLRGVAARVFSATLELQAAIDKTSNLDLNNEINLDGLATVSLVYL